MKKQIFAMATVFLVMFFSKLFISTPVEGAEEPRQVMTFASSVEEEEITADPNVPEVHFCGESTPLKRQSMRNRYKRELAFYTNYRPQAQALAEQGKKYFPVIQPVLMRYGIPDDFKYLPLVESGFQNLVSNRGAAGYWQMMPTAARSFGLEVNAEVDERYHLEKAAEAACKYLQHAYKELGNWTLVAASYNCGIPGVKRRVGQKGSFYSANLPEQTERFVFRLLAMKEIFENPGAYGVGPVSNPKPLNFYTVPVNGSVPDLHAFARQHCISYAALKAYNPWLRSDKLTNRKGKTYMLKLPVDKDAPLYCESATKPIPSSQPVATYFNNAHDSGGMAAQEPGVFMYTVVKGDNLYEIGKRYGLSSKDLIQMNGLKSTKLRIGQVLKIERRG